MQAYDIAIIGGGIAGLSLAYLLGGRRSVVVLEQETAPGYHATGRSAAEFVLRYNSPEVCKLAAIARPFFDAPPDGFAGIPLLRPRGGVTIANADKADRLRVQFEADRHHAPLSPMTADEAVARIPFSIPPMSRPPISTRNSGISRSRACCRAMREAPAAPGPKSAPAPA